MTDRRSKVIYAEAVQRAMRAVMRYCDVGMSSEQKIEPSIMRTSRWASERDGRTSRNSDESGERILMGNPAEGSAK